MSGLIILIKYAMEFTESFRFEFKKIRAYSSISYLIPRMLIPILLLSLNSPEDTNLKSVYFGCFAFSFLFIELILNIFGMDYGAHYLRYLTPANIRINLSYTFFCYVLIQLVLAIIYLFISGFLFHYTYDALILEAGIFISSIVLSTYWGILSSILYPVPIPVTFKEKVLRVNPGAGLIGGSIIVVLILLLINFTYNNTDNKWIWLTTLGIIAGLLILSVPLYLRLFKNYLYDFRYSRYLTLNSLSDE